MAISFFDIFNLVFEMTLEEFPDWKLNEHVYDDIQNDCEVMDSLREQIEIQSLSVSIDENNGDSLLEFGCAYFVIENCKEHPLFTVFSHTARFGFFKESEIADELDAELDDNLILRLEYSGLFDTA